MHSSILPIKILRQRFHYYHNGLSRLPSMEITAAIEGVSQGLSTPLPDGLVAAIISSMPLRPGNDRTEDGRRQHLAAMLQAPDLTFRSLAPRLAAALIQSTDPLVGESGVGPAQSDRYRFFFECREQTVGRVAAFGALSIIRLLDLAQRTRAFDRASAEMATLIDQTVGKVTQVAMDPQTRALADEADSRGIPWTLISPNSQLMQLGFGKHLHRFFDSLDDLDPNYSARFMADRKQWRALLIHAGINVADIDRTDASKKTSSPSHHLVLDEGQLKSIKQLPSDGQTEQDVIGQVHPDTRFMAERIGRVLGLKSATIDYRCDDIVQSCVVRAGEVLDVSQASAQQPAKGAAKLEGAGPILDAMFPAGHSGRIPIAAVTGTSGKTTTCRMLAQILRSAGLTVGIATTDSVVIGETILKQDDLAGVDGAHAILSDPSVDAAVLETARRGLLHRGMAFEWCDVAAVTNIGDDHLGEFGLNTREDMARLKRRVAAAAREAVVLNGNDPLCLEMAPGLEARRLILASASGPSDAIKRHSETGGELVTVMKLEGEDMIVRSEGQETRPIVPVADLPATFGGLAAHNTANAVCAAALALGLDLGDGIIAEGLRAFTTDQTFGCYRLTFVDGFPFHLLVDYAHNAQQTEILVDFAERLPTDGKRIIMLNMPGNRPDEKISEVGRIAAGRFDHYICFDVPKYRRGRPPGRIAELIREGLVAEGVAPNAISAHAEIDDAVRDVVSRAGEKDLVISQGTRYLLPFFRAVTGQGPPEDRYPTYLL